MPRVRSYRAIAKRTRARLFEEQGGRCYYCAAPMVDRGVDAFGRLHPLQVTLDHVIPRARGGVNAPTQNTVAACHRCNAERSTQDARLFMLEKQGMMA